MLDIGNVFSCLIPVSGTVGMAEVLLPTEENGNSQVACMYTGVKNLYRCYKR